MGFARPRISFFISFLRGTPLGSMLQEESGTPHSPAVSMLLVQAAAQPQLPCIVHQCKKETFPIKHTVKSLTCRTGSPEPSELSERNPRAELRQFGTQHCCWPIPQPFGGELFALHSSQLWPGLWVGGGNGAQRGPQRCRGLLLPPCGRGSRCTARPQPPPRSAVGGERRRRHEVRGPVREICLHSATERLESGGTFKGHLVPFTCDETAPAAPPGAWSPSSLTSGVCRDGAPTASPSSRVRRQVSVMHTVPLLVGSDGGIFALRGAQWQQQSQTRWQCHDGRSHLSIPLPPQSQPKHCPERCGTSDLA